MCSFQAILIFSIVKYEPLKYNKVYDYPAWGHAIGWTLAFSSILCIPLRAIHVVLTSKGDTLKEVGINLEKKVSSIFTTMVF